MAAAQAVPKQDAVIHVPIFDADNRPSPALGAAQQLIMVAHRHHLDRRARRSTVAAFVRR
jgi:hypothetical protein